MTRHDGSVRSSGQEWWTWGRRAGEPIGEGRGAYAYCAGPADGLPDVPRAADRRRRGRGPRAQRDRLDRARTRALPERMRLSDRGHRRGARRRSTAARSRSTTSTCYADEDEPEGGAARRAQGASSRRSSATGSTARSTRTTRRSALDSYTFVAELDFGDDARSPGPAGAPIPSTCCAARSRAGRRALAERACRCGAPPSR